MRCSRIDPYFPLRYQHAVATYGNGFRLYRKIVTVQIHGRQMGDFDSTRCRKGRAAVRAAAGADDGGAPGLANADSPPMEWSECSG